jgi:hypothetical protein
MSTTSQLFIPPDGAMQFEITHPETPFRGEVFWVMPTILGVHTWNWECKCSRRFEVLLDSLASSARPAFDGKGRCAVCLCVGRIIE